MGIAGIYGVFAGKMVQLVGNSRSFCYSNIISCNYVKLCKLQSWWKRDVVNGASRSNPIWDQTTLTSVSTWSRYHHHSALEENKNMPLYLSGHCGRYNFMGRQRKPFDRWRSGSWESFAAYFGRGEALGRSRGLRETGRLANSCRRHRCSLNGRQKAERVNEKRHISFVIIDSRLASHRAHIYSCSSVRKIKNTFLEDN